MPLLRLALALLVLLVLAVPAGAAPGEPVAADRDCLRTLRGIDLQRASIAQLQAAMATGTITAVELVDAYEARIAAFSAYNAVRVVSPDARARAAALDAERRAGTVRGPLHGIPVLLKDNVGTDDLPTTAGSVALEGRIPRRDAFLTARLRAAGAIVLGKTNLSEWANWMATGMPNGYSSLGGQVHNAFDNLDPSGSSAGSGVAASLALSAATIGTETSGSILSPSLANNVVGLKTTRGLVSRTGIVPLAERFDVPGPIVRSVGDAAAVLSAIAGPDPEDPATAEAAMHLPPGGDFTPRAGIAGVRLAYAPSEAPDPATAAGKLWVKALADLRAAGAVLVESDGFGDAELAGTVFQLPAISTQFHEGLDHYLQTEQRPGAPVQSLADVIAAGAAQPDKTKYGQDKLVTSLAAPAVKAVGEAQAQPAIDQAHAAIDQALDAAGAVAFVAPDGAHIGIGAAGGHPTVVIPVGLPDGKRMGVSFLGRRWSEPALLGAAGALEAATAPRTPPTMVEGGAAPASCAAAAAAPFTGSGGAAPGAIPAVAGLTPAAPKPVPRVVAGVRVTLSRPAFSARRTARRRGISARVIVRGTTLRSVRVTVRDARGRLVLSGSRARLARSGSVRLTVRRRLVPGPVQVVLRAVRADGTRLTLAKRSRLTA